MSLKGLTRVPTARLERLLRLVHRGELSCPISSATLLTSGLSDVADHIELLKGLDRPAVQAVIAAVIAERRKQPRILG